MRVSVALQACVVLHCVRVLFCVVCVFSFALHASVLFACRLKMGSVAPCVFFRSDALSLRRTFALCSQCVCAKKMGSVAPCVFFDSDVLLLRVLLLL